jgi:hypothetical protein
MGKSLLLVLGVALLFAAPALALSHKDNQKLRSLAAKELQVSKVAVKQINGVCVPENASSHATAVSCLQAAYVKLRKALAAGAPSYRPIAQRAKGICRKSISLHIKFWGQMASNQLRTDAEIQAFEIPLAELGISTAAITRNCV